MIRSTITNAKSKLAAFWKIHGENVVWIVNGLCFLAMTGLFLFTLYMHVTR